MFAGNVIARALGFLFPLVLARVLDRPDFALVYFFVNTGFFVGELVLAGFPTALTRFLAAPGTVPRSTWLWTSIVSGAPLLLISLAAGALLAAQGDASPVLLGLVIIGLTIDAYYFGVLRGLGHFGLLVSYRIGANLAQIVVVVIAWQVGAGSVGLVVAAYSLSYLVPLVMIEARWGCLRQILPRSVTLPAAEHVRALARLGLPALVSGLAYAAIVGLDVFWVRVLAPADLASYGAARALAMPMNLVPFAIGVVLMPRVAATVPHERRRLLGQALAVVAVVSAVAVVSYGLLSSVVVGVVYPASYGDAASMLPILAAGMGLVGTYSVMSQWWVGTGRALIPAGSLVVAAVASSLAHALLDATAGGPGAAVSMAVGGAVAILLLGAATIRDAAAASSEATAYPVG